MFAQILIDEKSKSVIQIILIDGKREYVRADKDRF